MKTRFNNAVAVAVAIAGLSVPLAGCKSPFADMHLDEHRIDLHFKDGRPLRGVFPYICSPERHHACEYENPQIAGTGWAFVHFDY
jgi:hypothetical protein